MLKLSEGMTACTKYSNIYPPFPNFREGYKYFNKEIFVTWGTEVLPVSLPPKGSLSLHYIISSSSNAAADIVVCVTSGRDIQFIISYDKRITTFFPINF
jgi:hypothetical protein